MRLLIKALLAATALMPLAAPASAQDGQRIRLEDRGGDRAERRAAREAAGRPQRTPEQRAERRAMRQAPFQPRPASESRSRGDWNRGRIEARPDDGARADTGRELRAERGQQRRWDSQRTAARNELRPAPGFPGARDAQQDVRQSWRGGDRDGLRADRGDWSRNRADRSDRDRNRDDWNRERADRDDRGRHGRRFAGGDWNRERADRNDRDRNDRRFVGGDWNRQRGDRDDRFRNGQFRNDQWRNGGRFDNRGGWNRTWRNDRRYDWGGYRTSNRSAYRLPRYYAPSGWGYGYRRFSIGVTLNSILWGENYWIDDPYSYRLPEAYGPYRWVRYYNDALLVDVRYGQVIDVVHDIFW